MQECAFCMYVNVYVYIYKSANGHWELRNPVDEIRMNGDPFCSLSFVC